MDERQLDGTEEMVCVCLRNCAGQRDEDKKTLNSEDPC
jgi:hypothetical protein